MNTANEVNRKILVALGVDPVVVSTVTAAQMEIRSGLWPRLELTLAIDRIGDTEILELDIVPAGEQTSTTHTLGGPPPDRTPATKKKPIEKQRRLTRRPPPPPPAPPGPNVDITK